MKRSASKLLSVLLVLCMALALLPGTALAADLIPLGTPTDPEWGVDYDYSRQVSSSGDETLNETVTKIPGVISWATANPDQNMAWVYIYRKGDTEAFYRMHWTFDDPTVEHDPHRSVDDFIRESDSLESGDYYFAVASDGDDIDYSDSEFVASDVWTYTKPELRLPQVELTDWNTLPGRMEQFVINANWNNIDEKYNDYFYCYEVQFATADTDKPGEDDYRNAGGAWGFTNNQHPLSDWRIEQLGTGYYFYRVRALSKDITEYQNGPWSEWSAPYNMNALVEDVQDALDGINADENTTLAEVQDDLSKIPGLSTAMEADMQNGEIIEKLTKLEETFGGGAAETSSDLESFEADKISVVGANLNKSNEDDKISLNVGEPIHSNDVIPELYKQTLAVQFSMDLVKENGESYTSGKPLAVPVQVTLPIPEGINPQVLRILHYSPDARSYDVIRPYIFEKGGLWYASFVLTHFSDFAMVQAPEEDEEEGGPTPTPTPNPGDFLPNPGDFFNPGDFTDPGDFTVPSRPSRPVRPSGSSGSSSPSTPPLNSVNVSNPSTANGTVTTNISGARTGDRIVISSTANSGYISAAPIVTDAAGQAVTVSKSADGTYTFTMPEGSVTITGSYVTPGQMFSDLNDSLWYREVIAYAVENGLMQGLDDGTFNPGGITTRGMVMTILARQSGIDTTSSGGEPWYQKGMDWARQANISDGSDPEGSISREQLAVMLYRFMDEPSVTGDLGGYPDAGNIQDWAVNAMTWAVQTGIIEGSDGKLNPQNNASRAETAAMLTRFCNQIKK